jgi:hypothetical protein
MKSFRGEALRFQQKLAAHEIFSLARFGDGESVILMGDHSHRGKRIVGQEYQYEPGHPSYAEPRAAMLDAIRYRSDSYYVGISCPHCVGDRDFEWLRTSSGQDEEHLTFATLYFYSNYRHYLDAVVPLYRDYEVVLVCNGAASIEALPFHVSRDFRVGTNAWVDDADLGDAMVRTIERERIRGALFVLCAGPFGSLLAHRLHRDAPGNSYVDTGSLLDGWFFPQAGATRRYLKGGAMFEESCDWRLLRDSGLRGRTELFA